MELKTSGAYGCISNIYEVLVEDGNSQQSLDILDQIVKEIKKLASGVKSKYIWDLIEALLEFEGDVDYIVREVNQIKDCVKYLFYQIEKLENKDKSIEL